MMTFLEAILLYLVGIATGIISDCDVHTDKSENTYASVTLECNENKKEKK